MRDERIEVCLGDITEVEADAIVNAANSQLQLGGGVAGAIRRKGGPAIQEECDRIGPIEIGQAAITGAGRLKARYVIHAAGMSLGEPATAESIADATRDSLRLADEHNLESIAFPAIGTGIAGFPTDECARTMVAAVREHLDTHDSPLRRIVFVLFDDESYGVFARELAGDDG